MTTSHDTTFDRLRRAAIELKLTDAARGSGIAIKPGAMNDLVARAFADHTTDGDGFMVTRNGGRHVAALEFLHRAKQDAPWFFDGGAGASSGGPGKTLAGGVKVIKASEMGANLKAIADGKVIVEATNDGAG